MSNSTKQFVTYQIAMLFRRDPEMGITPAAQSSQLLHFGVIVLHVVFDWQAGSIIDSDITSKAK